MGKGKRGTVTRAMLGVASYPGPEKGPGIYLSDFFKRLGTRAMLRVEGALGRTV